uniref:4HBT domain-containing protein n=1 Tax=Rhabditophanes sp. KR3021 TaxID=114890 RepID=A0AC35UI44_9BILA
MTFLLEKTSKRFFVARICRINYHEGVNTDRVLMEGVVTMETVLDHEAHAKLKHMFERNSHLYAILKKKADLKLIKMQPFAPTFCISCRTHTLKMADNGNE